MFADLDQLEEIVPFLFMVYAAVMLLLLWLLLLLCSRGLAAAVVVKVVVGSRLGFLLAQAPI